MDRSKKTPLTQNAYDRLKAELAFLEGEAREKVIGDIATARAHGDLSENAEYHAAKDQQGLQEARVRQLRQMIESAEIIEALDDGIVKPGTIVTIRYQGDDEPESYFYGLREEKQGGYDVVTPDSPLGRALLGRTAGETVTATVPAGELKVEVEEVRVPA
ncbi:MAG: transcription elongation factor GreA [Actinomycetota bacterium]|jgi:transcription elongation factor GreA|nr:transcription elongation factor GreA [Actinomycetota bacterium]